MALGDCAFYMGINTGATLTASGNFTFTTYENTGATLTPSGDTTFASYENAGAAPPAAQTVTRGSQGWGVLLTGPRSTTVYPASSNATGYTYEGDVTP